MRIFRLFSFFLLGFLLAQSAAMANVPPAHYDKLSPEQKRLLVSAYHIGALVELPETLQAVLLQETMAGKHGRVNWGKRKVAFGVTQIKPSTARDVLKKIRHRVKFSTDYEARISGFLLPKIEPSEASLKKLLVESDLFSLLAAAIILKDNLNRTGNWRRAVVAYYEGVSGQRRFTDGALNTHFYLEGIRDKLALVRVFNTKQGLR